jgi:hypothetical protein
LRVVFGGVMSMVRGMIDTWWCAPRTQEYVK